MNKTLWNFFYDADFNKTFGIPWKIYDTLQNNKLICQDYSVLDDSDTLLDDRKVISGKLVNRENGLRYVKVYVE